MDAITIRDISITDSNILVNAVGGEQLLGLVQAALSVTLTTQLLGMDTGGNISTEDVLHMCDESGIETGIDLPTANTLIIENADRFGLSQLHQLRGRVGRGQDKSYCVLFSNSKNAETQARLKALCKTNDGFKIAEEDLQLRGPGDFFGSRQHGLPQFKAASLTTDLDVMKEARAAAEQVLSNPDYVNDPTFPVLQSRIQNLFREDANIFN